MRTRRLGAVLIVVAGLGAATMGGARAAAASAPPPPVRSYGDAPALGEPGGLNSPLAAITSTPDGKGYWLLSAFGGVFTFGDAVFHGTPGAAATYGPFVGLAATADGGGYWIARDDGVVYNFGDAAEPSDPGSLPAAPIVGMASEPGTPGFWLVGTEGGVFTFDGARFLGSLGGTRLNSAIVGMAPTPDGGGYWLVGRDGGVFSFGAAHFYGSMGGRHLNAAIVGMAATADGRGYWLVGADGGVFSFGDAAFHGSAGSAPPGSRTPDTGMAATPDGGGYWLAGTGKALPPGGTLPRVVSQCESDSNDPALEPTEIILACGDGNALLDNLVWSSWTATGAVGRGEYVHNTCDPDCAEGTFVSAPASVRLSYPIETSAGEEFAGLSFTAADRSAPGGHTTYSEVAPTSHG